MKLIPTLLALTSFAIAHSDHHEHVHIGAIVFYTQVALLSMLLVAAAVAAFIGVRNGKSSPKRR